VQTRCGKALSPAQRAWVDLFAATGGRKAAPARTHARQVLALDQELTTEGRAYAALAGVAADVTLGKRADASRLLDEQRRLLPAAQMETAWFRYLLFALTARETAPTL
jgi:hypothetical protein